MRRGSNQRMDPNVQKDWCSPNRSSCQRSSSRSDVMADAFIELQSQAGCFRSIDMEALRSCSRLSPRGWSPRGNEGESLGRSQTDDRGRTDQTSIVVGFHGSNLMLTASGSPGSCCGTRANVETNNDSRYDWFHGIGRIVHPEGGRRIAINMRGCPGRLGRRMAPKPQWTPTCLGCSDGE